MEPVIAHGDDEISGDVQSIISPAPEYSGAGAEINRLFKSSKFLRCRRCGGAAPEIAPENQTKPPPRVEQRQAAWPMLGCRTRIENHRKIDANAQQAHHHRRSRISQRIKGGIYGRELLSTMRILTASMVMGAEVAVSSQAMAGNASRNVENRLCD